MTAAAIGLIVCMIATSAAALPIDPVYFITVDDAVTGDNEFQGSDGKRRWDVDPGADVYQGEIYERPTIQSYSEVDGRYSSEEYFQNLDITRGKVGWDEQFLYVGIELFGRSKSDQGGDTLEGLVYEYGFRFSTDPEGRNGFLIRSEQPELKHGTSFGLESNFAFFDTDGDVGGAAINSGGGPSGLWVTKTDNPNEETGLNGYDAEVVSDGRKKTWPNRDARILYSRVDPNNHQIVELAFDYTKFGLALDDILAIQYLDLESLKGDPDDPQNYFWNDKYTDQEAGSPNGIGGISEFGTHGLENIYELDTLRIGVISTPEPSTAGLLGMGCLVLSLYGRHSRAARRRPTTI
jgi:hypothetical protein